MCYLYRLEISFQDDKGDCYQICVIKRRRMLWGNTHGPHRLGWMAGMDGT